jgi:hypothetical protein
MASFPKSPGTCPVDIDETAEAYIMERLPAADALQFAIHCLTCGQCDAAVEEAKAFVRDIKAAAQALTVEPSAIDWQWSQAPLTRITPRPLVGAYAQMRFYVTGYGPPRT